MVEENSTNLYISVSSPDLNFNIIQLPSTSPELDAQERFYSVSGKVSVKVTDTFLFKGTLGVGFRILPIRNLLYLKLSVCPYIVNSTKPFLLSVSNYIAGSPIT